MATRYVRKSGSDSNGGTSPSDAWLTIEKATTTLSTTNSLCYVGAGVYREDNVPVTNDGSSGTRIQLVGDVDGAQTGDAGEVIVTAHVTNDTTAPVSKTVIDIADKTYWTFKNLYFIAGTGSGGNNGACFDNGAGVGNKGLTFQDCIFVNRSPASSCIQLWASADQSDLTFERCVFLQLGASTAAPNGSAIGIYWPLAAADYTTGLIVRNCLMVLGGNCYALVLYSGVGGSGSGKPGGGSMRNCTAIGGVYGIQVIGANYQTATPFTVQNCVIASNGGSDLNANTSGQIVEDYNILLGQSARTNISAGTNSKTGSSQALLFNIGQESLWGMQPRSFMTPLVTLKAGVRDAVSPFLGFGSDGSHPTTDFLNRIRPAGGGSLSAGVGYLERHDTANQETTTVDASGSGIVIVGPGDHDLKVPVDASATTLSIKARYDTTHAATNKPQVILLANAKLGVSVQTLTMTSAVDTWEVLSTSSFTPTAKGVVTLRLVSRSASGGGKAFFDTVA